MTQSIDKLSFEITVECAEEALVKAIEYSKEKLERWSEIMTKHNYHKESTEIENYLNILGED